MTENINNEVDEVLENPEEIVEEQIKETPEEVVEQEEPVEEPEEESVPEEVPEEPKPSRRESLRIQKLIEKLKENNKPESKIPSFDGLDYRQMLDADDEVITKLDEDRRSYGEQAFSKGIDQAKSIQFHTRLEIDAPKVISKYEQLDPENKEAFNPALADAVNSWYLTTTGYNADTDSVSNPDIRYSEFVDSIFELANEIAGEKVQKTVKNIAKQAAATGLRPDGSSAKRLDLNKPMSQMNDAELAAYGKKLGLA